YDGDPTKGGVLIAGADVPTLPPDKEHEARFDWPLQRKAGPRTLFAVADADNRVVESNKSNNTASAAVTIPDLLLVVSLRKAAVSADEAAFYSLSAANLTTSAYRDLSLRIDVTGPAGAPLASETVALPELAAAGESTTERTLGPARLPAGAYRLRVQLAGK